MNDPTDQILFQDLFELYDVKGECFMLIGHALEIIRSIHSNISEGQAVELFNQVDKTRKGKLTLEEFGVFLRSSCFNMPADVMRESVRALTRARRQTYRRRYLLYDTDQSMIPRAITENPTMMALYKDIFSGVDPHNTGAASKQAIRDLLYHCAPTLKQDIDSMLLAANVNPRGEIDFMEFVCIMRGARLPIALSDMARVAQYEYKGGVHTDRVESQRSVDLQRLRSEVLQYRDMNEVASKKTAESLKMGPERIDIPEIVKVPTPVNVHMSPPPGSLGVETLQRMTALEKENAEMKEKIENLQLKLHKVLSDGGGTWTEKDSMKDLLRERKFTAGKTPPMPSSDLEWRFGVQEQELQQAKVLLAMVKETQEWKLLQEEKKAMPSESESELMMRHQLIKDAISKLTKNDLSSPSAMTVLESIFNQYEYLVLQYRNMSSESRLKVADLRRQGLENLTQQPPPSPAHPTVVGVQARIPTTMSPNRNRKGVDSPRRGGGLHPSMSMGRASPRRADLDVTPTAAARNTRTLEDPLLTPEERSDLRSKLAAQMRYAARHYESPLKDGGGRQSYSPSVAPMNPSYESSYDAVLRLNDLTDRKYTRYGIH
eukprot:PhF_6_TR36076/c0_g1_i1/m.52410